MKYLYTSFFFNKLYYNVNLMISINGEIQYTSVNTHSESNIVIHIPAHHHTHIWSTLLSDIMNRNLAVYKHP